MSENENKIVIPDLELLEAELEREKYKKNYGRVIRSTIFFLIVVAAAAVLIAVLVLPVLQITGSSMADSLQDKDIVVALNSSRYTTGDIIAFYYNNNILIKRVIASAGDWVDIDEEGNVYVNEVLLEEPYVTDKALGNCNITLPYQVGCVSNDMVIGKILFRVWPISEIGTVN